MSLFAPINDLVSATRKKIRKLIAFLLNESHDYYSSFYPGNQSFIVGKILNHLVNKISIDNNSLERIKNTDPDSIVVFTCKNKQMFDFLYFHTLLKPMNCPYPELSFDLRFIFLLPVKQLGRIILSHLDYFFHHFQFKDSTVNRNWHPNLKWLFCHHIGHHCAESQ